MNNLKESQKETQHEAEALKGHFPDARIYTEKEALESTARREAGNYRYLHVATHGLFNDLAPLQSGILLAQPPPGSEDDGFWTAREILDLNLSADMVVLSACDTASGQRRGGEGMVGLTWALFVAGAPTQVVSQWAVSDAATADLMTHFYAHLKQSEGRNKGRALQAAMRELREKEEKYRHPFYWAPFILVGDWR